MGAFLDTEEPRPSMPVACRRPGAFLEDPDTVAVLYLHIWSVCYAGPYTDVTTTVLRLSNPSERRVCFKIKSNVPRQYCVQPSIDVVPPKDHVDVTGMTVVSVVIWTWE